MQDFELSVIAENEVYLLILRFYEIFRKVEDLSGE